jgi:hypothetical protein
METLNKPGGEGEQTIAENPNPAANENVPDDTAASGDNTETVGSEITDGEDA